LRQGLGGDSVSENPIQKYLMEHVKLLLQVIIELQVNLQVAYIARSFPVDHYIAGIAAGDHSTVRSGTVPYLE